jgi:hypothetical protein
MGALVYPENNETNEADGSFDRLANTMERSKYNDMASRRNSHFQERMSSVHRDRSGHEQQSRQESTNAFREKDKRHSQDNCSSGTSRQQCQQQQCQQQQQLYASISAEQVQEIDYSDYGF